MNISGLLNTVPGFKPEFKDIGSVISAIIPYIFASAGFLLVIYVVIAGLQMVFSMGNEKAVASAKGKLTNAVLGFIVIFVAYLLVQLIGLIFGVDSTFGGIFIK
jgi:hypothetical protein